MNRWYLVFVALLIVGPMWLWTSRVPASAQDAVLAAEPAVGRVAPDFELTTVTGETLKLSALRGQPVVLNFWATWCGPCLREMPALESASQRFADQVVFVGVDQGESQEVVQSFIDEFGVTFVVPLDSDWTVGDRYNVTGMPTTFFVDEYGVIRHLWVGEMNAVVLAEGIAKIFP